jgi:hypothetical protein
MVAAVAAVVLLPLLSGCVIIRAFTLGPQEAVIGDFPVTFEVCASGSAGCPAETDDPAVTGTFQVLLAVKAPDAATIPSSLVSTAPAGVTFTSNPSYAAEVQRFFPAEPGARWLGFISQPIDYATNGGPQSFALRVPYGLQRGADGGPFSGPLKGAFLVGARSVSPAGPATRPVACGDSPALHDELPPPQSGDDVWIICVDYSAGFTAATRDLGVLDGATASGPAGDVETLPFRVRFAGIATAAADFRLSATTELPGAAIGVTPDTFVPATDGTDTAVVAVGIPAGARPGTYGVTLRARLANGQTRSGTGRLIVQRGASGSGGPGAGGSAAARLRLSVILPRRLSARTARRRGVVVLIGATKPGPARVQLFQGRGTLPKASKRVRLRLPGPVRVLLKSARLRKGPYRIVIRADGRTFVRRAALAR